MGWKYREVVEREQWTDEEAEGVNEKRRNVGRVAGMEVRGWRKVGMQ